MRIAFEAIATLLQGVCSLNVPTSEAFSKDLYSSINALRCIYMHHNATIATQAYTAYACCRHAVLHS